MASAGGNVPKAKSFICSRNPQAGIKPELRGTRSAGSQFSAVLSVALVVSSFSAVFLISSQARHGFLKNEIVFELGAMQCAKMF